MSSLQSVIVALSVSYALIGALLLVVLVYARLHWSAKAVAVVVTSAFYVISFVGARGLLGWASVDRLPVSFKLLQARIVDPHTVDGDPGSVYLWVEALDDDNRPSGVPRAYRLPYSDSRIHPAESRHGDVWRRSFDRGIQGRSGGGVWRVVYAAASAAHAVQGRAIDLDATEQTRWPSRHLWRNISKNIAKNALCGSNGALDIVLVGLPVAN